MPERRPTLLRFAVAASWIVVPLLVGVMFVVAAARDQARSSAAAERHASVRQIAALKTFDQAIVARHDIAAPLPTSDVLVERVVECRDEWKARPGVIGRLRRALLPGEVDEITPATRIALDLAEIDAALARFSQDERRRLADAGLDGERFLDAVNAALATPIESADYPGQSFRVRCSDIRSAVASFARSGARMLGSLRWRGTTPDRVVAHWRPGQIVEIPPRHVARANPWSGFAGCIYVGLRSSGMPEHYLADTRDSGLCAREELAGNAGVAKGEAPIAVSAAAFDSLDPHDTRWSVPPSLAVLLQPLEGFRRPSGAAYRDLVDADPAAGDGIGTTAPHRVDFRGHGVEIGFSIDTTIDPRMQALAQRVAACYTGRIDVCEALPVERREDAGRAIGHRMIEQAMVRMAAVAIVDVATGRIEALAGAMSPCARQENEGRVRPDGCDPRMPYPMRYRPDRLLNPAVFHDAMPASTVKPILAAAFLSDPVVGSRWLAAERVEMARAPGAPPSLNSLRGQLMRSDSAGFLDRAFCADRDYAACDRMWRAQAAARTFGWNASCALPGEACGKRDLLFGLAPDDPDRYARSHGLLVSHGRLMVDPVGGKVTAPFAMRKAVALDAAKLRRCANGADGRHRTGDDWEKCSGGVVVDVVAEGWGQGHARASPVGGAGMMAMLAAAANGQAKVRAPHLVEAVRGVGNRDEAMLAIPSRHASEEPPIPIAKEAAQVILSGLSFAHRAGTSRSACEQVFDVRQCATMDWIAGKTGTPSFPNDERSLDDIQRLCAPGVPLTPRERIACGALRPYKWYVATYRTGEGDGRWTKAIAVLTERNWIAASGRVHGAGDRGPNPAAEIAMQIAGRQAGMLPWDAR